METTTWKDGLYIEAEPGSSPVEQQSSSVMNTGLAARPEQACQQYCIKIKELLGLLMSAKGHLNIEWHESKMNKQELRTLFDSPIAPPNSHPLQY